MKVLDPQTIFNFIVSDFEGAWDSVASNPSSIGRGNFLFGLHAMILLEWACRLCKSSPAALQDFSQALNAIESRYFTLLPGTCDKPSLREFGLPNLGYSSSGNPLIWAIYDLVRNGQAHQYQQIAAGLLDGKYFYIALTGPVFGLTLSKIAEQRPEHHLAFARDNVGDLRLWVSPATIFLDVKAAVERSKLLGRGLTFHQFTRPRRRAGSYQFSSDDLEQALVVGQHRKTQATLRGFS